MAYSIQDKEQHFSKVIELIESGLSLRKALKEVPISKPTFFEWVDADKVKADQYTRAMEERADAIADEILDIADFTKNDTIETERGEISNAEWINRSRLRVDSRKWLLGKLQPKKYGDKVDLTTNGKDLPAQSAPVINIISPNK